MGIAALAVSFERARRAEGLSPHTLKLYRDCIRRLVVYLDDDLARMTRRELTDFYSIRSETVALSTVWTDWKCHRVFVKWLVEEEELASDPMARMKPPRQVSKPVPVLSDTDLKALVAACEGSDRRARRDMAAMRLLLEGLRRGEVCGLTLGDIDLDAGLVTVSGKGKTRTVAVGAKTVVSLDRLVRSSRVHSPSIPLFGLTLSGLYQALRARADAAGLIGWHPHQMRHTAAHRWLLADGGESALMETMGWSSASMVRRYGASAAGERARQAQRRLGLADAI